MKRSILVVCSLLSGAVIAKEPQPVSIGNGIYMMTDRSLSIFGSSDGIVAKLMVKANVFCQKRGGTEAVLVDSGGSEAVPGEINSSGVLRRPAQGATGTIRFRCGSTAPAETTVAPDSLPDSYRERVAELRAKVLSGDIAAGKGILSPTASQAFVRIPTSDVELIERRSTWWAGEHEVWFIHLQNVSRFKMEAIEFSVNLGTCSSPTSPVQKTVIQLQRPIPSGEQAVINFPRPISTDKDDSIMCGVVTSVWGADDGA